jgi:hypothetical protein
MPKFIGNERREGTSYLNSNPIENPVQLTYVQQALLPAESIRVEVNCNDRGSRGRKAKRWFVWYASASEIISNPAATKNMRLRASYKLKAGSTR